MPTILNSLNYIERLLKYDSNEGDLKTDNIKFEASF